MDRSKKYLRQGPTPHLHIGKAIGKILKDKRISYAEAARRTGVNQPAFKLYLSRTSLQMGVLWNVSLALEHNFLADVMNDLPTNVQHNTTAQFVTTIAEQAETIKDLQKEIEIYKKALKIIP